MKTWKFFIIGILVLASIIGVVVSLEQSEITKIPISGQIIETEGKEPFRIGTVHRDALKMVNRFQPTADYLAEKLSNEQRQYYGKIIIAKDVESMELLLKQQDIDLYFESPLTSFLVSQKSNSVPILIAWKEGVEFYHSVFFVKTESDINSISDFKGKKIIFQGPESTSGYLLPLSHLALNGISVGKGSHFDMKFEYSLDDENTPILILENFGDVGVVSNIDFDNFPDEIKSQVRIVERTVDVPRQIISHRSGLDTQDVNHIKSILLNMSKDSEGLEALTKLKDTEKFSELDREKYDKIIKEIMDRIL